MSQNDSFVCLQDLSFAEDFNHQRRSVNSVDTRESTDGVPDSWWDRLHGSDDYDVLLLALKILCSKRENEVHDRTMNATDDNVVLKLRQQCFLTHLHLNLRLHRAVVVLVKLLFEINFG